MFLEGDNDSTDFEWLIKLKSVDDMVLLLEKFEEIRLVCLDSDSWERYLDVLTIIVRRKMQLFLTTITMHCRQYYVNLLSMSNPYSKGMDISLISGSGYHRLKELLGRNGQYFLGLLGPVLGLPEFHTAFLLEVYPTDERDEIEVFTLARRIYRSCSTKRDDVIVRIGEVILGSILTNHSLVEDMFRILWELEIRDEDFSLVVLLIIKAIHLLDRTTPLMVRTEAQSKVVIRLFEGAVDKKKYCYFLELFCFACDEFPFGRLCCSR
jgi:hypothetical protein